MYIVLSLLCGLSVVCAYQLSVPFSGDVSPAARIATEILRVIETTEVAVSVSGEQTHSAYNVSASLTENSRTFKAIQSLLQTWTINDNDVSWYKTLCQPVLRGDGKYSRVMLQKEQDRLALLLLCWPKGSISPIHSHGGGNGLQSQCFIKVVAGAVGCSLYN